MWIIRAYLNSIIYLCVLTWNMPLLSGIHTLSKTLQNWISSEICIEIVLQAMGHGLPRPYWTYATSNLENRRLYLKLCTLYKIIHGHFYFPRNIFLPKLTRCALPYQLQQIYARTNAFQSSFVIISVSLWNNLPQEALHAQTIHSLNHSLHLYSFNFCIIPLYPHITGCTLILAYKL